MNDQYDTYCILALSDIPVATRDPYETDRATCSCVELLHEQGLSVLSNSLLAKRAMTMAAQLIPTTTNITR